VQLELGISADLAPLAPAGASLSREQYLALAGQGLTTPELINTASDDVLLGCLSGSNERLRSLREAARKLENAVVVPNIADVLPSPTD
jgi:hypothetical protein